MSSSTYSAGDLRSLLGGGDTSSETKKASSLFAKAQGMFSQSKISILH